MSLADLHSLINIALFFTLVFVIKNILDSPMVLARHPGLKSPMLRFFLVIIVCCPLVSAYEPHLRQYSQLAFDLAIIGAIIFGANCYTSRTV